MTAETTTAQPTEGRCEHCKQTRPLFRYEPDHDAHLDPYGLTCRWCTREKQPLLCTRCWSAERVEEDEDPQLSREGRIWDSILEGNRRSVERRAQDVAAVNSIAAVSGMGGGSA
jgi:hypothetical protein